MGGCCGGPRPPPSGGDPCRQAAPACSAAPTAPALSPRFAGMVANALAHVRERKAAGDPIVGILCEYTPREVIMAAGGVPVCLCGGSNDTIPAAEQHLPANLCPLIKSTYGYHIEGSNPFLELCDLVVAETTCDGKKKMYELMAETRPMHVLQLPQRIDGPGRELWLGELRRLCTVLAQRCGRTVDDAGLRRAIAVMERERSLRRDLAGLMACADPPLSGRQLLELKSLASGIPEDLDEYARLLAELPGRPAVLPGAVRVLLTGVPVPHGAEKVVDLIEMHGGVVVAQENCTGLKPLSLRIDPAAADPLTAIADAYLHLPCSVMTPNDGRLELLREHAARFRPDCVVELVWQACLTYDVESQWVKRLAGELGLPYLRIGTDYASGDAARIAVRLEALFETARGRARPCDG
ncbi:MAG: 2-hydroxyacyl-CoA dehydratase [Planctomycetes bacterium]|nr:2-hydroxyacyl-CoA dehydratase [Planctomycetota bacterium]